MNVFTADFYPLTFVADNFFANFVVDLVAIFLRYLLAIGNWITATNLMWNFITSGFGHRVTNFSWNAFAHISLAGMADFFGDLLAFGHNISLKINCLKLV